MSRVVGTVCVSVSKNRAIIAGIADIGNITRRSCRKSVSLIPSGDRGSFLLRPRPLYFQRKLTDSSSKGRRGTLKSRFSIYEFVRYARTRPWQTDQKKNIFEIEEIVGLCCTVITAHGVEIIVSSFGAPFCTHEHAVLGCLVSIWICSICCAQHITCITSPPLKHRSYTHCTVQHLRLNDILTVCHY